ncbi:adenylate/guanylate cyclase domain-containing protein [Fulvivirga ulvae]|uniref:adenylate/guanylate cyclase domain-containing protein n=1 Tax=Fulvivirga ulvae TaxID=2904245 RepID=UPI001F167648|nr:adenylate/guanylate cyclase domain-containing protein [Fulvivirga ulvae]UII34080.1 adenylate/guanylate cyclase domain-containing protein [Fulvivirga ulvae]
MKKILSNNTKIKIRTVLFITIGWILVGMLNIYYNHLIMLSQEAFEFNDYDLETALLTNMVALFIAGLGGGSLIIFFLKDRLRKMPLGMVIIINMISFLLIIALVSILAFVFYYYILVGESYFDGDLWFNLGEFVTSYGFLLNLIVWTVVTTATIVVLQVNDKYGKGVFLETLLGKYHNPINEERIFMFLDLKSSTTIAEKLGHKKYFKLLNRFFEDVTKGVIENKGDIYQYVGDEVVITWTLEDGLENANCIRCFFEIESIINRHAHKYIEKYRIKPTFKAALHGGEVTTGEVGTFKKDIIFTGDVLNTTSRIEDKCNEFNAKLLVSESLIVQLPVNGEFNAEEIGDIELKGKQNPVKIYKVSRVFTGEEQVVVE